MQSKRIHHTGSTARGIALGAFLTITGGLHAASGDEQIDEVVVTGSKIEKTVTEMTHSVTVVDEVAIERQSFTDVTEILRKEAGVEFKQAGGVGQANYLKLRGLGSGNVLVVIDGVKINQASSGDTGNLLSQLAPSTIERVEILRGPQATLYGANSSAGVIAITTKSGDEQVVRFGAEAGSQDWRKLTASWRDSTDVGDGRLSFSLNASDTQSDNIYRYEFFEDRTYQLRTRYETDRFSVGASALDIDNAYGSSELYEAYCCQTAESHWAYQLPDPENINATTQRVLSAFGRHRITERLSQKLQISRAENTSARHDPDNGFLGTVIATDDGIVEGAEVGDVLNMYDQRSPDIALADTDTITPADPSLDVYAFYEDLSDQYDYQLLYAAPSYNLLAGVEYIEQSAEQSGSYGASSNEDSQVSYYLNGDKHLFSDQLVLALGVRLDDYESWGRETTGNFGFSWRLTELATLYGNVGTSFKPATMSQLFNPTYGDPSLEPESGLTREIGVRLNAMNGAMPLELTYWKTTIDDVIFFDYTIENPRRDTGVGQYNNGAEAESSGIEFRFAYHLPAGFTLDGNYTYTDSYQKAVGEPRTRTVQIARNKGNLGLRYQRERFDAGVNAYYSGERLRWAGDVEMPDYIRVDLSGRYRLTDAATLTLRVENLLDETIVEGLGFEEPGRYIIAGINFRIF